MLTEIRRDIEKEYFDRAFHRIDIAAHFSKADAPVRGAATVNEMIAILAQAVEDFEDSHTYFIPPGRNASVDYGWTMMAVGNRVLIDSVTAGSDAAKQGLQVGDELVQLNTTVPTRQNVLTLTRYYRLVRLQKQQHLRVRGADGVQRELDVASRLTPRRFIDLDAIIREIEDDDQAVRHRDHAFGSDVLVWRLGTFAAGDRDIARLMKKARGCKALVLDLRGNGGGSGATLASVIGELFDRDVTVGTTLTRDRTEPLIAKGTKTPFAGQLIVLVDSRSASAAEVLARVVQIENRGTVIGDRTAGMVMGARLFAHSGGADSPYFYGVSVTATDLTMSDGQRLEGAGVVPDALVVPSPADLASGRDPVLATAVRLAGATLTADEAAGCFVRGSDGMRARDRPGAADAAQPPEQRNSISFRQPCAASACAGRSHET